MSIPLGKIITAPEDLCLYGNADKTVTFFSQLYMDTPVICIDLSHTRQITAAAALALYAHVNNIQQERGFSQSVIVNCVNSPVERLLKKTKLLDALTHPVGQGSPGGLFQFVKCAEIEEARKSTFERLDYYQNAFSKGGKYSVDEVEKFFRTLRHAIKEAQLNIANHAYIDSKASDDKYDHYRDKMWWQMFWYIPARRQVHFLIYDLGVGIVDSYVNHATVDRKKDYSEIPDNRILEEALKPGMSRMIGAGRGFGLSYLTEPLDNLPGSSLFLRTGRAAYHRNGRAAQNNDLDFVFYPDCSLSGTMVEWSFQLPH